MLTALRRSRLNFAADYRGPAHRRPGAQQGREQAKPDLSAHRACPRAPSGAGSAFSYGLFQFREAPVPPVPDGVPVPLGGAQGWLLPAEAPFPEQPPHLGRVIGDTEFLPDHLGNPCPGPDLPGKPEGTGPLLQQLRELGQLAVLQFAWSSRRPVPPQGLGAFLPGQGRPPAHRTAGTPRAPAASIYFQPFCSSSQARSRRASIHTLERSVLPLFMRTIIPQVRSNVY